MTVPRFKIPAPLDSRRAHARLWLAVILLASALVGIVAGFLTWLGGANPANAILAAGAAFSATALLAITLIQFARS